MKTTFHQESSTSSNRMGNERSSCRKILTVCFGQILELQWHWLAKSVCLLWIRSHWMSVLLYIHKSSDIQWDLIYIFLFFDLAPQFVQKKCTLICCSQTCNNDLAASFSVDILWPSPTMVSPQWTQKLKSMFQNYLGTVCWEQKTILITQETLITVKTIPLWHNSNTKTSETVSSEPVTVRFRKVWLWSIHNVGWTPFFHFKMCHNLPSYFVTHFSCKNVQNQNNTKNLIKSVHHKQKLLNRCIWLNNKS